VGARHESVRPTSRHSRASRLRRTTARHRCATYGCSGSPGLLFRLAAAATTLLSADCFHTYFTAYLIPSFYSPLI
jgi:hypothetical protein